MIAIVAKCCAKDRHPGKIIIEFEIDGFVKSGTLAGGLHLNVLADTQFAARIADLCLGKIQSEIVNSVTVCNNLLSAAPVCFIEAQQISIVPKRCCQVA